MERVSIVTVSYNQAEFLERTILSVLEQNYPEIEYIVVDPGSTDGSREIIEQYRSRISKIIFRPDRGAADGLNRGFREATGDVFGFLNSDDVLLTGAVASAVRFLEAHKDIDVVSGNSTLIGPGGEVLRYLYSDRMSLQRCIYGGVILIQPSTFFRRQIFERVGGFSTDNRICWDGELFLKMARSGGQFARMNELWSGYRVHLDSISNSKSMARRVREVQESFVPEVLGRRPRLYDKLLVSGHRSLRKLLNPRDTWERVCRGPVSGRFVRKSG